MSNAQQKPPPPNPKPAAWHAANDRRALELQVKSNPPQWGIA